MTAALRHHPAPELILDCARGALERGRALVLATHIGACPTCRAQLELAEAVGGALLAELEPADMASDALERALASLDTAQAAPADAPEPPAGWIGAPPEVLLAATRRRRWAAPGVWVATITRDRRTGARSYLLGVGPGIAIPRHTHEGVELICVLKGAYEDRGERHNPGDFVLNDEGVEHRPQVTRDAECVCLIATDHALVPRSLTAHLFQPFVRI
jgi:putative transcriptional regulator